MLALRGREGYRNRASYMPLYLLPNPAWCRLEFFFLFLRRSYSLPPHPTYRYSSYSYYLQVLPTAEVRLRWDEYYIYYIYYLLLFLG